MLESAGSFAVILVGGATVPLKEDSYRELEKRMVEGESDKDEEPKVKD